VATREEPLAAAQIEPLLACNILVAVDGSLGAHLAVAHAAAIARVAGGRLTLLAVIPHPKLPAAAPMLGYDPHGTEEGWAAELRAAAERAPRDVPITLRVAHGDPAVEIVRQAEEGCHDLIVLGCEGRGPLRGALRGTSQRVLRRSRVPVLVVRVPKR
jgi:nucleotide-binding universal stress UspA family protein